MTKTKRKKLTFAQRSRGGKITGPKNIKICQQKTTFAQRSAAGKIGGKIHAIK